MIELTDAAISQATKKAEADGKKYIRVGVKPSGCVGYKYLFDWTDTIRDDDTIISFWKFKIIIDSVSWPYLRSAKIDFVRDGLNEQFKIINPLEETQCGCGASVQFSS